MSVIPGIGSKVEHDITQAGETHPRYWMLFAERENSPDDDPGDEDPIIGLRSATTAGATDAKVYMGILSGVLPTPEHNVGITDISAGVVIETDRVAVNPGILFNPQSSIPVAVEGHLYYNLSTHQLILRDNTGWSAISAGSVVASLDDLIDVTIAAPALGEHLVYNGSIWVNTALALGSSNQLLGMDSAGTAQEYKTFASNVDFIDIVHAAGSVTFNDAANPLFAKKTGWDFDARDYLTMSFDDPSRTFTLTPASPYYYWIQGVKYSFSAPQDVIITDTEGLWYIYFVGSTLTASQTPWTIIDEDKALVAYVYWNATANECIFCGFELHGWDMDSSTHGLLHATIGTMYQTGLALTDNADGTLDMSPGSIHDEDINILITDSAGSDYFEQDLTPIQIPIYYLDGASAEAKRVYNGTSNTYYVYQDGSGNPYWNEYTGGAWQLTSYANNAYGCYWIIATNDIDEPIIALIGQGSTSVLPGTAQDNNPIESLNMGAMLQEFKVLFRVTLRNTGTPYTTSEIEDFRASSIVPGGGYVANDHGALGGLQDDDHIQYLLAAGTRALTANWDVGAFAITALNYVSDVSTGTQPYACTSTTLNTNLNADMTDGYNFDQNVLQASSPTFVGLILSGAIATPTTITTSSDITCGGDLLLPANKGIGLDGTAASADYQIRKDSAGAAGIWMESTDSTSTIGAIGATGFDAIFITREGSTNKISMLYDTSQNDGRIYHYPSGDSVTFPDAGGIELNGAVVTSGGLDVGDDLTVSGNDIKDSGTNIIFTFDGLGYITNLGNQGSPSDDDVLAWDTGASKWIVQAQTGGTGGPGSGTQWTIPVWDTASTLGDSMISQDAGGTALTVGGALTVTGGTQTMWSTEAGRTTTRLVFNVLDADAVSIYAYDDTAGDYENLYLGRNGNGVLIDGTNGNTTILGDLTVTGGDIISSAAISMKASGDSDDYLQFNTDTNRPGFTIIGGNSLWLGSDAADWCILNVHDGYSNYGYLGYDKVNHFTRLKSIVGKLQLTTTSSFVEVDDDMTITGDVTVTGGDVYSTNIRLVATSGYAQMKSAANQHMYWDAGLLFNWRDIDASGANRMTLNSSNGDLWVDGDIACDGDLTVDGGDIRTLGASMDVYVSVNDRPFVFYTSESARTVTAATSCTVHRLYYDAITPVSSITLKDKIQVEDIEVLARKLDGIVVKSYEMKHTPDKRRIGFIAEEMPPEIGVADTDDVVRSYNPDVLLAMMFAKVQYLENRIVKLEAAT